MIQDLPVQAILAIATLTASLIAATMSFVNLTLTKEQKTSEFRQAWIDSLRDDLSVFFACARAFSRATEEQYAKEKDDNKESDFSLTKERISDIRYQISEVFTRIKLRLNSEEPEHEELLRLMQRAIDEQNKALKYKTDSTATIQAIEIAVDFSRPIIKTEWKRVKRGERPFRIARNWVAPIVFVLSVLCIAFIFFQSFKVAPNKSVQSDLRPLAPFVQEPAQNSGS
ncbi:hypothetical protein [Photobacterium phosphoreum]|uniref:hypothetical protein n=1 Tax=Photobacterium phosphoreum TaxID=659 RepID=UPI0039B05767